VRRVCRRVSSRAVCVVCRVDLLQDKRCKKFIPVHHSVLAAAASQDLAGKFGIALTTGTSLQKVPTLPP
jgi:phage tail sheath protein FI